MRRAQQRLGVRLDPEEKVPGSIESTHREEEGDAEHRRPVPDGDRGDCPPAGEPRRDRRSEQDDRDGGKREVDHHVPRRDDGLEREELVTVGPAVEGRSGQHRHRQAGHDQVVRAKARDGSGTLIGGLPPPGPSDPDLHRDPERRQGDEVGRVAGQIDGNRTTSGAAAGDQAGQQANRPLRDPQHLLVERFRAGQQLDRGETRSRSRPPPP